MLQAEQCVPVECTQQPQWAVEVTTGQSVMFTLIGLVVGVFLGYLASGYLGSLQPLRQSVRQAVDQGLGFGRNLLGNLTSSFGQGPLINIGILILVVLLLLWLVSFSTALVIGALAGIIYADEVGNLPFVSGLAGTIRQKLSGRNRAE